MAGERRNFHRYPGESRVAFGSGGGRFEGRIIDYSLDGLGASVPDSPPLKTGDSVSFDIDNPLLASTGRIVWAAPTRGGLRLGVNRTGGLSGSLKDFRLADVLIGLQRCGRTGALDIADGLVKRTVYFESGDLLYSVSNREEEDLGRVLLYAGRITQEQFDRSREEATAIGRKQGALLVGMGAITPQVLFWAVQFAAESIIVNCFNFRKADFHFSDGRIEGKDIVKLKLSVANIVYRGIIAMRDADHVTSLCPPGSTPLCFSSDPLDLFQDLGIEDEDKGILKQINCKNTIADIVKAAPGDKFRALKAILALLSTRTIEPAGAESERLAPEHVEAMLRGFDEDVSADHMRRIDEMFKTHASLGYYGVLGIGKNANRSEIKKAFYDLAREFHPDRHYHLPADAAGKLATVFSYITSAYSTLTNPARREEYDRKLAAAPKEVLPPAELARRKCRAGVEFMGRGDFAQASRLFSEAVYYDEGSHEYHYYLGMAYLRDGKHKDAEKSLRRALAGDPQNAAYMAEIGHAYLALGFSARAQGNFEKALKADPRNARAREGLALVNARG